MTRRTLNFLLLLAWLLAGWLPAAAPAAADTDRQQPGTPSTPTATLDDATDVNAMLTRMSVAEKVGQLFMVTFQGDNVSENSDIATLIRDYKVGGVVLLPANQNFQTIPAIVNDGGQPSTTLLSTPLQIAG